MGPASLADVDVLRAVKVNLSRTTNAARDRRLILPAVSPAAISRLHLALCMSQSETLGLGMR